MNQHLRSDTQPSENVVHGAESFTVSEAAEAIPEDERIAITKEDLKMPEDFNEGDTIISLICNVKDIRTSVDGEMGVLYPEQAKEFQAAIDAFIEDAYKKIPDDERDKLDVLVIAGDTKLVTPGDDGLRLDQQRAVLTGERAVSAVTAAMERNGIDPGSHLIADNEKPVAISHLRDVSMLHETDKPNVKQFVDYMTDKYGSGRELWMAYEDDSEHELREQLGVEGPNEIAERMDQLVGLSAHMADLCRQGDRDRRVIVLAVGHYDNISPWAKQNLMGIKASEGFIPVEKGGGVVVRKDAAGHSETEIGGKKYLLTINE